MRTLVQCIEYPGAHLYIATVPQLKNIVVLYHANCPDGFGSAFAAWKKFGTDASYIPVMHNKPYPDGLADKEVYICDFSYPNGILLEIEKIAKRLVVLDHHLGAREWVIQVKEHVFDNDRSGAGITWDYFHPGVPRPLLISYIEDDDLYRYALADARPLLSVIHSVPRTLLMWNRLAARLENEVERARMIETGRVYAKHLDRLVDRIISMATIVRFEGYECYLASAPEMFVSDVGHRLSDTKPPIALVVRADAERITVSLRSNGTVDVSEIAKKYGGGGHPGAAGFSLPFGTLAPWTRITP
jgi:uncharacterized protein